MAEIIALMTAEEGGSTPWSWSSITEEAGNTFAPSTDQAYAGSNSYEAALGGSNDAAYGTRTFTAATTVWGKFYIYIPSTFAFADTSNRYGYFYRLQAGANYLIAIAFRGLTSATPNQWQIEDRTNLNRFTTNFSTDAWHLVKFQWVKGATADAIVRVWIDGTLVHEYTNLTHNYNADRIYGGMYQATGAAPLTGSSDYIDNLGLWDSDPDASTVSMGPLYYHFRSMRQ